MLSVTCKPFRLGVVPPFMMSVTYNLYVTVNINGATTFSITILSIKGLIVTISITM
jgi:hypothetical protein